MVGTSIAASAILIPYRYRASAAAFLESVHRARNADTPTERRQHVSVARIWYDTLAENLRALKLDASETRAWINDHAEHPLLPRMREHLACVSGDASLLDRALTDLLVALSLANGEDGV